MNVSFDDFTKLDLRIGTIKNAENVAGSDKLLKLIVDIGNEERQLIAGIGKYYKPEHLAGRQIVVLTNLEPKEIMGETSRGMLLAADVNDEPVLLGVDKEVPDGTIVH